MLYTYLVSLYNIVCLDNFLFIIIIYQFITVNTFDRQQKIVFYLTNTEILTL